MEAKLAPKMPQWMVDHANKYMSSGGKEGHIYKVKPPGYGDLEVPALLLTTTADVAELERRSAAALRDSGWFVRCRGETDVDRLGALLRVGAIVAIAGAGSLQSGNWFVWSVRHQVTREAVKLKFTLARNAMGPPPSGGAGSLLGGLA